MPVLSDACFQRLVDFVIRRYGINLACKRALVEARLSFDISRRGFSSYEEYLKAVMANPSGTECQHMIDRLSTNHTYFFRETDCMQHMLKTALPSLCSQNSRELRIWCAAASSGQEPYTLAMLLEEELCVKRKDVTYSILATDINTEVLQIAQKAIYADSELKNIPQRYLHYCQDNHNGSFAIEKAIRTHITWQQKNLMEPFGFRAPFDFIFCRNVMIYFQQDTRQKVTGALWQALRPNGYLYVGTTESIDLTRKLFRYIAPSIYQKGGDSCGKY